jgi:hypothetical protein
MLLAFGYLRFLHKTTCVGLAALAWTSQVVMAQSATDLGKQPQVSYQLSADLWHLKTNTGADLRPGFVEQSTNLLLPNSATQWRYKDVSAAGWVTANKKISNDVDLSFKARADQTIGTRIEQAQVQKDISPFLGVRAGIVDYKTSWCRTYEQDNGWIREIDAMCNTPQFRDVTGGAPGFQIYASKPFRDFLVQGQLGVYDPLLLGYAPKEFGNLIPSPQFEVQSNKKYGFNINAVNLYTGLEARLSFIHTFQTAFSPEPLLLGQTKQESDLIYLGLNAPLSPRITGRITHTQQTQKATCRSTVALIGSRCNSNLTGSKSSSSAEVAFRLNSTDHISTGISRTTLDNQQQLFSPKADIVWQAFPTTVDSQQISIAWRRDWGKGVFTVLQHMRSKQHLSYENFPLATQGHATGLRLGYRF